MNSITFFTFQYIIWPIPAYFQTKFLSFLSIVVLIDHNQFSSYWVIPSYGIKAKLEAKEDIFSIAYTTCIMEMLYYGGKNRWIRPIQARNCHFHWQITTCIMKMLHNHWKGIKDIFSILVYSLHYEKQFILEKRDLFYQTHQNQKLSLELTDQLIVGKLTLIVYFLSK